MLQLTAFVHLLLEYLKICECVLIAKRSIIKIRDWQTKQRNMENTAIQLFFLM